MKKTCSFLSLCLLAVMFVLHLAGCAHEKPKVLPAPEIFKEAGELAQKGKVDQAAEKYMEVRTYYPGDELAKRSLLATADLYYDNELYESALQSYQEFRVLYPTDAEAGYAFFRIGMSNFKQMGTFDRDQTQTVKAIQSFENFIASYPSSPRVLEACDHILEAKTLLAKHYMYVGKFYLKKKDYTGACRRFQYVKSNFPGVELEDDLNSLISTACSTGVKEVKKP